MSYDLLFLLNKNRRKENLKITYNVTPPKHYLFSLHCYSSNALIYLNNRKKNNNNNNYIKWECTNL